MDKKMKMRDLTTDNKTTALPEEAWSTNRRTGSPGRPYICVHGDPSAKTIEALEAVVAALDKAFRP